MNVRANSGDINKEQDFAELHDSLNGLVAYVEYFVPSDWFLCTSY